jgi:hypothetical protein
MATFILGKDAKLYHGAAGSTPSTEMSNVRDVTLTLEAGEADVTTRANSGWRATAPTLRECTCEFEMVWDPADAGFHGHQERLPRVGADRAEDSGQGRRPGA